jgi:hypothetical protein
VLWRAQDGLAMAAIRFLTTLAKSVHSALFQDDAVLQQARAAALGPLHLNTKLSEESEEMLQLDSGADQKASDTSPPLLLHCSLYAPLP